MGRTLATSASCAAAKRRTRRRPSTAQPTRRQRHRQRRGARQSIRRYRPRPMRSDLRASVLPAITFLRLIILLTIRATPVKRSQTETVAGHGRPLFRTRRVAILGRQAMVRSRETTAIINAPDAEASKALRRRHQDTRRLKLRSHGSMPRNPCRNGHAPRPKRRPINDPPMLRRVNWTHRPMRNLRQTVTRLSPRCRQPNKRRVPGLP